MTAKKEFNGFENEQDRDFIYFQAEGVWGMNCEMPLDTLMVCLSKNEKNESVLEFYFNDYNINVCDNGKVELNLINGETHVPAEVVNVVCALQNAMQTGMFYLLFPVM